MYPILFKIGNFPIYTYGFTMALGFVIAFGWIFHEARRLGDDLDDYYNVCLIALIGGILGSRILYIIVNWKEFSGSLLKIVNLREGGLVWYGGVILVVFLILGYTRLKGLSFYRIADVMVAPLSAGLGVGRLGCLMSGCCYGCPTTLPWGIKYPQHISPDVPVALPEALRGVRVHPSPIYEMLAVFALAGFLTLLQRRKSRDGQPLWAFFMLYGIIRFVLEFWRGDVERGFVFNGLMSTSQLIGLPIIFVAMIMLWRLRKPAEDDNEE